MPSDGGRPPVAIVGMHRSGTSMLAALLQQSGLFLGHRLQDGHTEARFFQELNEYALTEAAASWDRPDGVATLLANDAVRRYLGDYFAVSAAGPRSVGFLGPRRWLRYRSLFAVDEPWGWKDPRTTVLLPLWLEVFPAVRVLHVTRHGVDVADSLRTRSTRGVAEYTDRYRNTRRRYGYIPRQRRFTASLRVADLDAGVELWDRYTTAAHEVVSGRGALGLEVRYEDLVARPYEVVPEVLRFCELDPAPVRLDHLDPARAFAHREDPDLRSVAERHVAVLARHGYR